jgi:hypothetical protein
MTPGYTVRTTMYHGTVDRSLVLLPWAIEKGSSRQPPPGAGDKASRRLVPADPAPPAGLLVLGEHRVRIGALAGQRISVYQRRGQAGQCVQ